MSYAGGMNHHGLAVWLTGLPCSGKSTLAQLLCARLMEQGYAVEILDGDEVRQWLTPQLGYSRADRDENIRRIARVAQLLTRVGAVVLVAVVSPYRSTREEARALIGNFVEVFVDSPLEVCIQRDVKGMYRKALNGELAHFTGVSDPYEPPPHPEVVVRTNLEGPQESTDKILSALARLGYARHLVR